MNMRRNVFGLLLVVALAANIALASGDPHGNGQTPEVTFIKDTKRMPNVQYQLQLRESAPWANFLNAHPNWSVIFNEENQKPHRAFGAPIPSVGSTYQDKAMNFINDQLQDFTIPVADLNFTSSPSTSKHTWVNYNQFHNGLEVLFSRMFVKFNMNDAVIQWAADVYDDIDVSLTPSMSITDAASAAQNGLWETVTGVTVTPDLKILPIPNPDFRENTYKLVYEVWVEGEDAFGIPSRYCTFVDAENGEVLYRQNFVMHHDTHTPPPGGDVEVTVEATVYPTHSYNPSSVEPLPNLSFTMSGTHYTDNNGYVNTLVPGPDNATFTLSGTWCYVQTGATTPNSGSVGLVGGPNTFNFDADANIRENTAYYHVNRIHDYMKSIIPAFTGMDFSLETNVDVAGSCNAFYNGSSINFYQEDLQCLSYATVGDVVYHEYGHGINDNFYSDLGATFWNGATNEGYADVWGYAENEDPLLGDGGSATDPTDVIRRYDIDPKVYPQDIVNQVHSDGEIIAGAWWDTYVNLGNDMPTTMSLFALAYPGLQATLPNGNEGQVYSDIYLDVLEADDDNGDLTDGTPNFVPICEAFYLHGITLLSNGSMAHTDVQTAPENNAITIDATYSNTAPFINYLQDVTCYYQLNESGTWLTAAMPNIGGNNYQGSIPAQPEGTIIQYYVAATDIWGKESAVVPIGANADEPTLPYFIMVGWDLMATEDSDFTGIGSWDLGVAGDNNTTGTWEVALPIPSYCEPGPPPDLSTLVAPGTQYTPGGTLCFVTENANSSTDGVGTNDVDAGHTTLRSSVIDLSAYTNPAVSYWRWYDNAPGCGANPASDWWQVEISDDGGSSWTYVENTRIAGRSWQRHAFRVADYVSVNNNFRIRFVASDSTTIGEPLDGGSLVEAAVDDIKIWEQAEPVSVDEFSLIANILTYPNPATTELNMQLMMAEASDATLEIYNSLGMLVYSTELGLLPQGPSMFTISTETWSEGNYMINVVAGSSRLSKTFTVVR